MQDEAREGSVKKNLEKIKKLKIKGKLDQRSEEPTLSRSLWKWYSLVRAQGDFSLFFFF